MNCSHKFLVHFGACIDYDPTIRGRFEVQKNKWRPYYMKVCIRQNQNPKKNFAPRRLLFYQTRLLNPN
jgi:hypothetical protein